MNFKNINTTLDLSLFKTTDDAEQFILETKLEIEDINNQIKDYTELLEISKKIETELDVDPDWIIKAQCARRIKLNHVYLVEQWLKAHRKKSDSPNKEVQIKLTILEQQIESLKKKIDHERQTRANCIDEQRKQIGFGFRSIRELYNLLVYIIDKLEIKTPALITQAQLNWVDEVITKNPNALLLQKDVK